MSPISREAFFTDIRNSLFGHHLTQAQVDGINAILDYTYSSHPNEDMRSLAYILATTYHETGAAMEPVEEVGKGAGTVYGRLDPITHVAYYGRGLVQLTWKFNYIKQSQILGLDLVNNPDLAMEIGTAVKILVEGMFGGHFTGRKLTDYFSTTANNATGARAIINGNDRAALIATYFNYFLFALNRSIKSNIQTDLQTASHDALNYPVSA